MAELLLVLAVGTGALAVSLYLLVSLRRTTGLRAAFDAWTWSKARVRLAVLCAIALPGVASAAVFGLVDGNRLLVVSAGAFAASAVGGLAVALVGALSAFSASGAFDDDARTRRGGGALALAAGSASMLAVAAPFAWVIFEDGVSHAADSAIMLAAAPFGASVVARVARLFGAEAARTSPSSVAASRAMALYEIGVAEAAASLAVAGAVASRNSERLPAGAAGALTFVVLPLVLRALGIVASTVGTLVVRREGDEGHTAAFTRGLYVTVAVATVGFAGALYAALGVDGLPFVLSAGVGVITGLALVHTMQVAAGKRLGTSLWTEGAWTPALALAFGALGSYALGEHSGFRHGGPYAVAVAAAATLALSEYTAATCDGGKLGVIRRGHAIGSAAMAGLVIVLGLGEHMPRGADGIPSVPAFAGALAAAVVATSWWARSTRARSVRPLIWPTAAAVLVPTVLAGAGEVLLDRTGAPLLASMAVTCVVVGTLLGLTAASRTRGAAAEDLGTTLLVPALAYLLVPWLG